MSLVTVSAEQLGLDDLGRLSMESLWQIGKGYRRQLRDEVSHNVTTSMIHVEPASVLYWDGEPERENSLKRFRHMLGLRAYAELGSVDEYRESLDSSIEDQDVTPPMERRLGTLLMLAGRYTDAPRTPRVNCLRTDTASIFFRYEPPRGRELSLLHDFLKGRE